MMIAWLHNFLISSRDQKLLTILQILENMLGTDDSRRKAFVRFWSNFGYPVAFRTKLEATNHINLMKLLQAVDITRDSSNLMTYRMVKAVLFRRQFVLQKFEHLFQNMCDEKPDIQGKVFLMFFILLFFHFSLFPQDKSLRWHQKGVNKNICDFIELWMFLEKLT